MRSSRAVPGFWRRVAQCSPLIMTVVRRSFAARARSSARSALFSRRSLLRRAEFSLPRRAEAKGESGGELRSEPRKEGVRTGPGPEDEWVQAEEHLREIMLRKLKELAGDLSEEQDLSKMKRQLDCIEGLHKILQSLSR